MNRIILADNQAIFRAGAARVLAMEDDMRIVAQCGDSERLMQAVSTLRSSIIIVASTLPPDFERLFAEATSAASRVVLLAENGENTAPAVLQRVEGLLTRSATGIEMVECVRKVSRGYRSVAQFPAPSASLADSVGTRVRERLTPRELQIVGFIVQGCKNKEIALQIGTKEQVVKNYLRSIYDKTGVSDRLELALFTIHHRVLAEAASRAGQVIQLRSTA
jgi:DNA-binding NarL/FixJ family response regulator